jgi:AAA15 family ATPase/GTPase
LGSANEFLIDCCKDLYYGDYFETRYDFEEGVNIIVADNGAGKSKFFNAFLTKFNICWTKKLVWNMAF